MRVRVRAAMAAMLGLAALFAAARVEAQIPPATKTKPAAGKAAAPLQTPARPPGLDQVVATVNGEKVTKGDLINLLSRYQLPPDSEEQIYHDAVESIINTRLIGQYLTRLKINVSEARIDAEVATLEKQLKSEGGDLASTLLENNTSIADVRKEIANRIRWVDFVKSKATDAELKKFVAARKDLLSGTQVKTSHILLKVAPDAKPAEKEKARAKLLQIKRDVEQNKITFAEAANKNSEDQANTGGAGGDIGYFGLNTGIVKEFANAAFALKPGAISDPVETVYGFHLIQVTDRKEGPPIDLEAKKPFITQMFAAELQKQILEDETKKAKIEIKPMPADLFPPVPVAAPGATKPAAPGTGKAAEPKK